ncbi:MAG TPA: citrate/2-methylcitrate synthase [Candidatus Acidoferrales bacterium]|nr:citrate/2-methylcitrate synthase [Candidatus Acidoferrales bacterium]
MSEFSPGLEGVLAARTEISEVDGQNGRLIYRGGYLIQDLAASCGFEEVAFLLLHGELPTAAELRSFRSDLAGRRELVPAAAAALQALPPEADPMDVLRTALSAQGAQPDLTRPSLEEAVGYVACLPTIVGAAYRRRQGEPPVAPHADLDQAANLLYMMLGREATTDQLRWVDQYLLLLADHGLNASTFTARVVASTGSDLCSCLVGAVAALKGPAHGGAATGAMKMLEKIGSAQNAEPWLAAALDRHERLMGFGHRVYRTYDPRAKILRETARSANPGLYETARVTEEAAIRLLHERHPERPNATNVDYWSSVVLAGAGIPKEFFTCVFAISRVVGWSAHVLESMKDLRIIRPMSEWVGPPPTRKPVPIADRGKAAARQ